ncbi:MAG: glycosyl hydrolase, partial [Gammaproteobacteria bacterium]|nr:glycosyl hydrolase [Gammaproteobacteria bacterium]
MRPRALLLALLPGVAAAAAPQPPAEPARLAAQSLLIALAAAGPRLVAVGDRGVVVLSDDGAAHWRQAQRVPTQVLLTGVCFFDAQRGIA